LAATKEKRLEMVINKAFGGQNTNCSHFIIRFKLNPEIAEDCFTDMTVAIDDTRSILDLYENAEVKKRVRNCFTRQVVDSVKDGYEELVLSHRNSLQQEQLLSSMPVDTLGKVSVKDLWGGLPRNSEGIIAGCAFPVTLQLETRLKPAELDPRSSTFL